MEDVKFFKKCPKCDKEIFYKRKGDLQQGRKNNTICKQCVSDSRKLGLNPKQYFRNCPQCNILLEYSDLKFRNRAEKLNKKCRSCASPFKGQKNKKLKESLNILYSDGKKLKECKTCKNQFSVNKWNENKKYCTFECYINNDDII